jgi:hypothetical protein
MIVWLNGAFGVGKTTTAARIRNRAAEWRPFDVEWVGYMLRANLSDHKFSDFQELPPWRKLVPRVAREIIDFTGESLIAVQSVLRRQYWDELRKGLATEGLDVLHVVLDADEETLRSRIAGDQVFHQQIATGKIDPGALAFRLSHLETYAEERAWMIEAADLVVDAAALDPDGVATLILDAVTAQA